MNTQVETLTESQTQILEEFKKGFVPRMTPSTPEELMQIAADLDAGRIKGMPFAEVKAIADALRG